MSDIREMTTTPTDIDGLMVVTMKQAADERGTVREFYRESAWLGTAAPTIGPWVQVNVTASKQGAVRGLHAEEMTKLIAVVSGEAFGAYVDTRRSSPTFGTVVTQQLTPGIQVLVPRGVANGFQSVTDTEYLYCFDREWEPGMAGIGVNPLDPALAIPWPRPVDRQDPAMLSAKDAAQPDFDEATAAR